jgi:hypothetical protein
VKKTKELVSSLKSGATTKGFTGTQVAERSNVSQQQGSGAHGDSRNVAFGKVEAGNIGHSGAARKSSTGKSGSGK